MRHWYEVSYQRHLNSLGSLSLAAHYFLAPTECKLKARRQPASCTVQAGNRTDVPPVGHFVSAVLSAGQQWFRRLFYFAHQAAIWQSCVSVDLPCKKPCPFSSRLHIMTRQMLTYVINENFFRITYMQWDLRYRSSFKHHIYSPF